MGDDSMSTFIKIGADTYDADDYSIPTERTFRDAWDTPSKANVISVNMDKARDIWRDKIRYARTEPLAKLDTDYMKALETSFDTTQIVADKQALRDAPSLSSIDEATTPEELVAIQPVPNVVIE
jgi:hypothetical protein